jgi:hypothetical protein
MTGGLQLVRVECGEVESVYNYASYDYLDSTNKWLRESNNKFINKIDDIASLLKGN